MIAVEFSRPISGRIHRLVRAMTCVVAIGCAISSPVALAKSDTKEYRGDIKGPLGGRISFEFHKSRSGLGGGLFDARHIVLRCDDGTTEKRTFPMNGFSFTTHRQFDLDVFSETDIFHSNYRVHGVLLPNGRARGFLLDHRTKLNPEGSPIPDRSCTTVGGKQRWSAKLVGHKR